MNNDTHDQVIADANSVSADGTDPNADKRDSYFTSQNEQSYSAPSAPVLTPPVDSDPEAIESKKENAIRTQSIKPL